MYEGLIPFGASLGMGILGGLLSSTAATALYARRSRESDAMERLAIGVVPLALRALWPLAATIAAGGAAFLLG